MDFYFFNLMPYGALDLEYDKKYASANLLLPNSYYDPEEGHKLYTRYMDELEYADELGFDGVCVNEHHQTAYGLMPTPGVIAGALARNTRQAKVCVLGRALPLVNNPLMIAEEFSMLDNITKGRFVAGFVRGLGVEYHAMGINPAFSLERFHEAHDLVVRAWTEIGPFAFEGKHYHLQYVNLWPRPYSKPHPEVWIPSQGSEETIRWAAHPDRRYTYLNVYSPFSAVEQFMGMYRRVCEEDYGYEAEDRQLGLAVPIYVGETDEIAAKEARPHIEAFFNKFLRIPNELLLPPGYTSISSLKAIALAKREMLGGGKSMERMNDLGMFICGSADTVRTRLEEFQDRIGLGRMCTILQFGTLPHELTRKNMELFATKVMPHFRGRLRRPRSEAAE